jgi:light-regulated signal transduction histidine kinase (bacteriophytochrome)
LGYTKEELLLKPVQLLHTPKSKLALKTVIDTYKSKGVVSNAKLTLKGKKSKQISVILNITSAKNTQGQITESRFSWTDISVLELMDKERAENAKKLVLKNKELEQFAFIASHDLQEPLRTVSSFSGLLANKYHDKLDQTGKDSLGFITNATTRMQDLVKGLLDYSRIGKNIEITDLSIPDIIVGLTIDLSLRIKETLTVIETHNLPINIKGYKLEMRQLFYNLIVNAMKFCAKGVNPKILITATEKNEFVEFCVADNGIGVSKEHQKKIFEIFKRLHIREEYEGTGIGLAHCQKIVELHGGKIWVESELGQGSKFYFTISKKNKTLL